jgi:hypothetical protein
VPLRLLTLALCATAVLCIAAPASAHHSISASAALTLEPPRAGCKLVELRTKSRCDGSQVVRVDWSWGPCAEPDRGGATVHFWTPRPGGGKPVELEAREPEGMSGALRVRFDAGVRVFATVTAVCDSDGDGDTIPPHTATAESPATPEAYIPPRLTRVQALTNSFCGLNVPNRWLTTVLQARQPSGVDFSLTFDDSSLLGVRRFSRAGRAKTILYARGAGLKFHARARSSVPGPTAPIPTGAGMRWVPRKGGTLKVWAVIGGYKTNVLAFRVVPPRCRF